jgi:hypothetical protein
MGVDGRDRCEEDGAFAPRGARKSVCGFARSAALIQKLDRLTPISDRRSAI